MSSEALLGLHVSAGGSLDLAFDRALEVGCNTFQIFTRNPRTWAFRPLEKDQVSAFRERRRSTGFKRLVAHMPYLPNLASPVEETKKRSRTSLAEEVRRCDLLGIDFLVAHLGSHMGSGAVTGMKNVADAVNQALAKSLGETTVLLENMAGQKNSVGSRFEELGFILEKVKKPERVGVCLDTCHVFAEGFDLRDAESVADSMAVICEAVGYDRIKTIHLNDSKGALGSKLDRHENIGKGKIGAKGLRAFLRFKGVTDRPLIMETPYEDVDGMRESVSAARSLLR